MGIGGGVLGPLVVHVLDHKNHAIGVYTPLARSLPFTTNMGMLKLC